MGIWLAASPVAMADEQNGVTLGTPIPLATVRVLAFPNRGIDRIRLTLEDAEAIKKQVAGVTSVVPEIMGRRTARAGSKEVTATVYTAADGRLRAPLAGDKDWPLERGASLTVGDSEARERWP